ncbi:MAG: hypothetical protein M1827_003953 [Pycnora praestabilis]|nr:MAG: hypothetical protein M1827_003953 [Pycnora praestabilis]
MAQEQSLNIPQLLAVILVGFVVLRWFFSSSSSSSSTAAPGDRRPQDSRNAAGRRADPRQVEQIAQMFPQVGRREIMWDLQRNGGSMAATTERVLGGRLERPPPSFQPQALAASTNIRTPTPVSSAPVLPDLITRYNLSSKISPTPADSSLSPPSPEIGASGKGQTKQTWSQNKNERQQLLQRRREEMILAARRKLEDKDKAQAADPGT